MKIGTLHSRINNTISNQALILSDDSRALKHINKKYLLLNSSYKFSNAISYYRQRAVYEIAKTW